MSFRTRSPRDQYARSKSQPANRQKLPTWGEDFALPTGPRLRYLSQMISDTLLTRRVGVIPGENPSEASSLSLSQTLKLLDALIARNSAPLQIEPLATFPKPDISAHNPFAGFVLGHSVLGSLILREIERPAVLAAPFLAGTGAETRSSHLIWPFEDTSQVRSSDLRKLETWVETTCLPRSGIEAAVRVAEQLQQGHVTDRLYWVNAGYGEIEDFALAYARSVSSKFAIEAMSIEQVPAAMAQAGSSFPSALLCIGRTAIPLGRFLGIQGWVGWSENGFAVAQAWGEAGPALTLSFFLDRLGLAAEAELLEQWVGEILRDPSRANSVPLIDLLLRRFI